MQRGQPAPPDLADLLFGLGPHYYDNGATAEYHSSVAYSTALPRDSVPLFYNHPHLEYDPLPIDPELALLSGDSYPALVSGEEDAFINHSHFGRRSVDGRAYDTQQPTETIDPRLLLSEPMAGVHPHANHEMGSAVYGNLRLQSAYTAFPMVDHGERSSYFSTGHSYLHGAGPIDGHVKSTSSEESSTDTAVEPERHVSRGNHNEETYIRHIPKAELDEANRRGESIGATVIMCGYPHPEDPTLTCGVLAQGHNIIQSHRFCHVVEEHFKFTLDAAKKRKAMKKLVFDGYDCKAHANCKTCGRHFSRGWSLKRHLISQMCYRKRKLVRPKETWVTTPMQKPRTAEVRIWKGHIVEVLRVLDCWSDRYEIPRSKSKGDRNCLVKFFEAGSHEGTAWYETQRDAPEGISRPGRKPRGQPVESSAPVQTSAAKAQQTRSKRTKKALQVEVAVIGKAEVPALGGKKGKGKAKRN